MSKFLKALEIASVLACLGGAAVLLTPAKADDWTVNNAGQGEGHGWGRMSASGYDWQSYDRPGTNVNPSENDIFGGENKGKDVEPIADAATFGAFDEDDGDSGLGKKGRGWGKGGKKGKD